MNLEQLREEMQEAGGNAAYIDLADEGCFILDGSFTLAEIAALGDVARRSMGEQTALVPPVDGPQIGDRIRMLRDVYANCCKGDEFVLVEFDLDGDWWVRGSDDAYCCIGTEDFEVVR